jgi:hypothetical protein
VKTKIFPKLCQDCADYDQMNDKCRAYPELASFSQVKAHILERAAAAMSAGVPITEEIVEDSLQRVIIAD